MHLQKVYADLGYQAGDFPDSGGAVHEVLWLPMFPELSEPGGMCEAIHQAVSG